MIEFNLIAQGRQLMYEVHLLMQSFLIILCTCRILTLWYKVIYLGSRSDKKSSYLQNQQLALHKRENKAKQEGKAGLEAGSKDFCMVSNVELTSWTFILIKPCLVHSTASSPCGMYRSHPRYRPTIIYPACVFTGYSGTVSSPCRDAQKINPINNYAELSCCDIESS